MRSVSFSVLFAAFLALVSCSGYPQPVTRIPTGGSG